MFSTLESTWDKSAHRGRATLASFTLQAFALSLLIAISLLWVERPPQVRWVEIPIPPAFAPRVDVQSVPHHHAATAPSDTHIQQFTQPQLIPHQIATINDADANSAPAAPDLPEGTMGSGRNPVIPGGIGDSITAVIPKPPAVIKPLLISHLAEANLLHRVQPVYPALARQARIQGSVELRAIISKSGTIENLVVVSGHPMLSAAAIEAVRQWRYRPYMLNNEPVEVETEITVNFLLSGG
jgi:periplasmic protein TonB